MKLFLFFLILRANKSDACWIYYQNEVVSGIVHKWRHGMGEKGQTFSENRTSVLVIKSAGEGGLKIVWRHL